MEDERGNLMKASGPHPISANRRLPLLAALLFALFALTACASPAGGDATQPNSGQVATIVAATLQALPTNAPAPTAQPAVETIVVAFIKGRDIYVWDSLTQQSELIFDAGDAAGITLSSDGRFIVFFRRWVDANQCEQAALWVVGRDGSDPGEIASPAELRDPLRADGCGDPASLGIDSIEWLPETHRLLYSLTMNRPDNSVHQIYLADADALSTTLLVSADYRLGFVPSPDGQHIALMSTTGLGFINADGTDWRRDVLTYPDAGYLPRIPGGVWTRDGSAFLISAPTESDSVLKPNFALMRVPLDGSAAQLLVNVTNSAIDSFTFSPDGRYVAFFDNSYRGKDPLERRWGILPLPGDGELLAIPYLTNFGAHANVHWSPAGMPYGVSNQKLFLLCPNAVQSSDTCDEVNPEYLAFAVIQWLNGELYLVLSQGPSVLFLGSLDHTTLPIAAWPLEEGWGKFSAVLLTPGE
jgi:hypothetical protein